VGKAQATQPSGRISNALTSTRSVHTCFPGIRLVWADSGYAGKLVGWAAKLRRTVQIVAKLCRADHFRGAAPQVGGRAHLFLDQPIPTHVRDYEPRPEHHAAMAQWAMTIITTRRLARHQHT
jgi:hypothetical protein